jgi:isohexenylglutaconyl-CoA hydratase
MMVEIGDAVDRVAADRSARAWCCAVRRRFCAGGDLGACPTCRQAAQGPGSALAHYRCFGGVLRELNRMPRAVIAVVEGPAVGGGFGMVVLLDVVICTARRSSAFPNRARASSRRRSCRSSCAASARTAPLPGGDRRDHERAARGSSGWRISCALPPRSSDTEAVLRDIGRWSPMPGDREAPGADVRDAQRRGVMDRASVELVRLLRRPEALAGMRSFLLKKPPPWGEELGRSTHLAARFAITAARSASVISPQRANFVQCTQAPGTSNAARHPSRRP